MSINEPLGVIRIILYFYNNSYYASGINASSEKVRVVSCSSSISTQSDYHYKTVTCTLVLFNISASKIIVNKSSGFTALSIDGISYAFENEIDISDKINSEFIIKASLSTTGTNNVNAGGTITFSV